MMTTIVFSKDRAMQLRLLLESMQIHAEGVFNPYILYKASNDKYKAGYEKLIQKFPFTIFIKEKSLYDDIKKLVHWTHGTHCCFFTDDSFIYRKFPESAISPVIDKIEDDVVCFSLRVGLNTTVERYWDGKLHPKLSCKQEGEYIKWQFNKYTPSSAYGYPYSVDGHIYRKSEIYTCLDILGQVKSVNDFEVSLGRFHNDTQKYMTAFSESVLVNCPVNRVQNIYQNTNGIFYPASPSELNRRYLDGETIDLKALDVSNIKGTHQEIEFVYRKLNNE